MVLYIYIFFPRVLFVFQDNSGKKYTYNSQAYSQTLFEITFTDITPRIWLHRESVSILAMNHGTVHVYNYIRSVIFISVSFGVWMLNGEDVCKREFAVIYATYFYVIS